MGSDGPKDHISDTGLDPPWEWTILRGKGGPLWNIGTLPWAMQKRLNRSRCRLLFELGWVQGTIYYMGSKSPMRRRNLQGKDMPGYARPHSDVSCAKMAEPIEIPFGLWTQVGPREPCIGCGSRSPEAKGNFRWKYRVGQKVCIFNTSYLWNDLRRAQQLLR